MVFTNTIDLLRKIINNYLHNLLMIQISTLWQELIRKEESRETK